MLAVTKRLEALPSIDPAQKDYLARLCNNIVDVGSTSWSTLQNRQPDRAWTYLGNSFPDYPGLAVEIGDSQAWEGEQGVKNKAIGYEDDSRGMVTGVVYFDLEEQTIAMIGSISIFPDCPRVKYLDGTFSTHAVEVIPLTKVTDATYVDCLLPLKLVYFAPGNLLLNMLQHRQHDANITDIGFYFTFQEIGEIMKRVNYPTTSLSHAPILDPNNEPALLERPWEFAEAVRESLFTTPPVSPPYWTV